MSRLDDRPADGAPDATEAPSVVEVRGVTRTFRRGRQEVDALRGVDLTVVEGRMVALHGRSGSGKTTLLNVVGGLDTPTSGTVTVCGTDLAAASEAERVALRRDRVAFVFQAFGLLPVLSAAENVEVPLRLHAVAPAARRERVGELLALVGLDHRASHRPAELSGGEQQRVAIARALAIEPALLIADEPTGQLDSGTGRRIMDLLRSLVDAAGLSMLVATHDPTLLADADVVHELRDGILQGGVISPRFDGDIDRTKTLTESTTLPQARRDEHAAFRPESDDGEKTPARRPSTPVGGGLVGAPPPTDDHASERTGSGVRWGPDGEVIDD